MRTTIDIPSDLLAQAMRAAGVKTKTSAIILGLKELLHHRDIANIRRLRGQVAMTVDTAASRRR